MADPADSAPHASGADGAEGADGADSADSADGADGADGADAGRGDASLRVPDDSPIADSRLDADATSVAEALRRVRKRAPLAVRQAVRAVLAEVFRVVHEGAGDHTDRLRLARRLEELSAELRGTTAFVQDLYEGGRLGVIRHQEPIKIRGAVDHARIQRQFVRYEERARRAEARLRWFLARAGEEDEPPAAKPWEQPYANMDEYHELLWGRVQRNRTPPR